MNAARVHIQTAKEAVTSPEKRSELTRKAVSTISQIPAEMSNVVNNIPQPVKILLPATLAVGGGAAYLLTNPDFVESAKNTPIVEEVLKKVNPDALAKPPVKPAEIVGASDQSLQESSVYISNISHCEKIEKPKVSVKDALGKDSVREITDNELAFVPRKDLEDTLKALKLKLLVADSTNEELFLRGKFTKDTGVVIAAQVPVNPEDLNSKKTNAPLTVTLTANDIDKINLKINGVKCAEPTYPFTLMPGLPITPENLKNPELNIERVSTPPLFTYPSFNSVNGNQQKTTTTIPNFNTMVGNNSLPWINLGDNRKNNSHNKKDGDNINNNYFLSNPPPSSKEPPCPKDEIPSSGGGASIAAMQELYPRECEKKIKEQ